MHNPENAFRNINMYNLQTRKSFEKNIKSVFSAINVYLWLHFVGFTHKINCKRKNALKTTASLLLSILAEGNAIFLMYRIAKNIQIGESDFKNILANVSIIGLNEFLRFFFYTRRQSRRSLEKKLSRIYNPAYRSKKVINNFKFKLIAMLFLNDVNSLMCLGYSLKHDEKKFDTCKFINTTILFISSLNAAVTAYFCSLCFVLKETLTDLKEGFERKPEKESLFKLFRRIMDVISDTNGLLHPFLLTALAFDLVGIFRSAYVTFMFNINWFIITSGLFFFIHLVFICQASSSVMTAVNDVKYATQKISLDSSRATFCPVHFPVDGNFSGFKMLNSITIDSSLILTAIGGIVTYGVLIATLNTK